MSSLYGLKIYLWEVLNRSSLKSKQTSSQSKKARNELAGFRAGIRTTTQVYILYSSIYRMAITTVP